MVAAPGAAPIPAAFRTRFDAAYSVVESRDFQSCICYWKIEYCVFFNYKRFWRIIESRLSFNLIKFRSGLILRIEIQLFF